jgi:NAD(P)-dependent dehydrogenase (short-subunit alcohol dehydrogenase family)
MGAFGASKMMNIKFTYELSRRLYGTGVTANVFYPGLVKSNLTKEMPAVLNFIFRQISNKPDKAAKGIADLVMDNRFKNSNGIFYKFNGEEIKSSKYSYDETLQKKLWTISEQLSKSIQV